jgi:hypothetical protein
VIIDIIWNKSIDKSFFDSFQSAVSFPGAKKEEENPKDTGTVTLADCLEEFERSELLDEDNKWYCNKCKDHVQATKTL